MSQTLIVCATTQTAFADALNAAMQQSGAVDEGAIGYPAIIAPGHHRHVYVAEYPEVIDEFVAIDDISPAMVRDEFERALGQRDAFCVALHFGDVELLKKLLIPILERTPTLVDNDD